MRNIGPSLAERLYYTARERNFCRRLAAEGKAITHMSCLPQDEIVHLNAVAAETAACLTPEAEITARIDSLRRAVQVLRRDLQMIGGTA